MTGREESHRMPEGTCPACGAVVNRVGHPRGQNTGPPMGGDLTVCITCAAVLQFGTRMELVLLAPRQIRKLPQRERRAVEQLQWAVRKVGDA